MRLPSVVVGLFGTWVGTVQIWFLCPQRWRERDGSLRCGQGCWEASPLDGSERESQ